MKILKIKRYKVSGAPPEELEDVQLTTDQGIVGDRYNDITFLTTHAKDFRDRCGSDEQGACFPYFRENVLIEHSKPLKEVKAIQVGTAEVELLGNLKECIPECIYLGNCAFYQGISYGIVKKSGEINLKSCSF